MISDDGSDEDDDEGGWLTQKFDNPPVSARSRSEGRRPLDPGGYAVSAHQQPKPRVSSRHDQDPFGMPTNASRIPSSVGFEDSFTFDVRHRYFI